MPSVPSTARVLHAAMRPGDAASIPQAHTCLNRSHAPPARRAASAKEVVKRGQDVWVKVISVSGGRLSLSMRDVDQATGRDLLPGARMAADGVNPSGPASGPQAPGAGLRGLSGVNVCLAASFASFPSSGCHGTLLSVGTAAVRECPRGAQRGCMLPLHFSPQTPRRSQRLARFEDMLVLLCWIGCDSCEPPAAYCKRELHAIVPFPYMYVPCICHAPGSGAHADLVQSTGLESLRQGAPPDVSNAWQLGVT